MTGRASGGLRALAVVAAIAAASPACSGPGPVTEIVVLGTTDVHGHLLPHDYATGTASRNSLAQVATLIDSVRRADPNVVLVDSGDLIQGTPLDEYQAKVQLDSIHPAIAAMNQLRYDASALGNHEFNYGIPYLERALRGARMPFVAANIYVEGTDSLRFPPYRIVERAGVRVGILGLTTPGVTVWDRRHVSGRLRFEDLVESARRWIPEMLKEGADVVIVAAHSGVGPGSSYDEDAAPEENALARLAIEVPGIDVIFAGHTREPIDGLRVGGTLILHAGKHAEHLAVARLTVRKTPDGAEVESRGHVVPVRDVAPNPELVALASTAHSRAVDWLGEPIGATPDVWSARTARIEDSAIGDLITSVQREVTGAEMAAAAVFETTTRFGPGPITRRDILALYRYPNTLRAVRVSGADVRAFLERSALYYRTLPADPLVNDSVPGYDFDFIDGVDYALDLSRPAGARVVELLRNGRPVAETDSFTLALNNYRQSGGGGFEMVAGARVVYADEVDIASRIVDFLLARDTIRTSDVFHRNWELRPESAVARLRRELEETAGRGGGGNR